MIQNIKFLQVTWWMCWTPVSLEPMILTQATVNLQCKVSEGGGMTAAPRLVVWPCPTTTPSITSAGSAAQSPQSDWLVPQWWSDRGDSNDGGITHSPTDWCHNDGQIGGIAMTGGLPTVRLTSATMMVRKGWQQWQGDYPRRRGIS